VVEILSVVVVCTRFSMEVETSSPVVKEFIGVVSMRLSEESELVVEDIVELLPIVVIEVTANVSVLVEEISDNVVSSFIPVVVDMN